MESRTVEDIPYAGNHIWYANSFVAILRYESEITCEQHVCDTLRHPVQLVTKTERHIYLKPSGQQQTCWQPVVLIRSDPKLAFWCSLCVGAGPWTTFVVK